MTQPTSPAALLFNLGPVPVVTLEGPDARRFANGMFTQNVRDLVEHAGARSAMTDDRGRVLGLLDLYCTAPDAFLLVLEGVDSDWFQSRYGMFIVFDDVEVEDLTGSVALLSVQGPAASACVAAALDAAPPTQGHQLAGDVRVLSRDRTGLGGWDLLVPTARLDAVHQALVAQGAEAADAASLQALRVHAGQPLWPVDRTGERTFVHELRLRDQVCSFNKGCYVGQEVINRMDTMGKLTRQLQGLKIAGTTPPEPGAALSLDGDEVGVLGSVAQVEGRLEGLAVLRKKAWAVGTCLQIGPPEAGCTATVCELPFD